TPPVLRPSAGRAPRRRPAEGAPRPGGRQAVAPSQVAAMLVATNRLVENARSLGVELVYVRSEAPAGGDLDLRLEHPSAPVFWNDEIDVLACPDCGGRLRALATIQDTVVVRRILSLLGVP